MKKDEASKTKYVPNAHRSWLMSRVKGKNTSPEVAVRKIVHAQGFRFRLHRKDLPGKPDIVVSRMKKVIFVHGCFWHGHENCSKFRIPKTRSEFWIAKFEQNRARDRKNIRDLKIAGWSVLLVWQCELKSERTLWRKINKFLRPKREIGLASPKK